MAAARAVNRLTNATESRLTQLIEIHGSKMATPVSVRDLYNHGMVAKRDPVSARLSSARWLHRELPIRLAHRVRELEELPLGLAEMPSVIEVRDMYQRSFADIVHSPAAETVEDERQFAQQLDTIRTRHDSVVKLVARGVLELKERHGMCASHYGIRRFLDSF